ncbi:hypothetical protein CONCODRAFT_76955 [Conidiobolus coronatus NRRL 28638]|uniref:Uncharacterized protein n=1 Tax=Conidiobolus coronatus (strain ATCC 28846 / CBS 209.66 / NRRL 28638) TaxID=796925 RepID=A0A137PGS8_CONC2|nr:hypothetical protein CONCODRAFT_76955 [Conidiobolus coronatus NRRL 28638]|eukprot:KXN74203.1 hypothetical protein CONCODRAFT_76955 [Conidiobolus coronatus NRRL 28638]
MKDQGNNYLIKFNPFESNEEIEGYIDDMKTQGAQIIEKYNDEFKGALVSMEDGTLSILKDYGRYEILKQ